MTKKDASSKYAILNKKSVTNGVVFIVQRDGKGGAIQSPAYKQGDDYFSNADATQGRKLHKLTADELKALRANRVDFTTG